MDSLKDFTDRGAGLFVKPKEGDPQTLRILTLDPLVSKDQWGNTRYSFTVWNWTLDKAQILSKGPGVLKQLQAIHLDDDFEPLNKLDVKLIATGEGLETRYSLQVLPKAKDLDNDKIKEAAQIKLEEKIEGGIRLSKINDGEELPSVDIDDDLSGYEKAKQTARKIDGKREPEQDGVIENIGDEEISLDQIPF